MKRFVLLGVGVLVAVVLLAVAAATQFKLSALPEPGPIETFGDPGAFISSTEAAAKAFHRCPPTGRQALKKARGYSARNAVPAMEIAGITPRMRVGGCTRELLI